MTAPFFSIVIATYNRSEFIGATLRSLQEQSFSQFEVIVVDDGSKDNTRQVVSALAEVDNRIRYFYQDNAERGAARNNGWSKAAGAFVLFFDSDDLMPRDTLKEMRTLIEAHPTYHFFAPKFVFSDGERKQEAPICKWPSRPYGLEFALEGNPIGTFFCVRRDFDGYRPFPEDRSLAAMEDWICLVWNLHQEQIVLGDFIGCELLQHDGRSMQQHALIIEKKLAATRLLEAEVPLSQQQLRELWANSYYFCAIHSYLDGSRKRSYQFVTKAVRKVGLKTPFLLFLVRATIGKANIERLKPLLGKG